METYIIEGIPWYAWTFDAMAYVGALVLGFIVGRWSKKR